MSFVYRILVGKQMGVLYDLGDLRLNGSFAVKWVVKKQGRGMCTGFVCLRIWISGWNDAVSAEVICVASVVRLFVNGGLGFGRSGGAIIELLPWLMAGLKKITETSVRIAGVVTRVRIAGVPTQSVKIAGVPTQSIRIAGVPTQSVRIAGVPTQSG
jgi:hypothetical protein